MTGRGIDQILPHPSNPLLHEEYMDDARDYVSLAESKCGPIPRAVSYSYTWGDALDDLERAAPACRIVNLETAVTTSNQWAAHHEIHYRMHPANIGVLSAAGINACALANNHVLDWGQPGLLETLHTLHRAGIQTAGAGKDRLEAQAPAVLALPDLEPPGRILVFACGMESSGVPPSWTAGASQAGVDHLPDFSPRSLRILAGRIARVRRNHDLVILSIHWGSNWGYEVPEEQQKFARALVDEAGVDLIHGHSSHHVRGLEIHAGKLILHGCGDFLTDYEGISGYEEFRSDLVLMYLPSLDSQSGRLLSLRMIPYRSRRFQLQRASLDDSTLLRDLLVRESRAPGFSFTVESDGAIRLQPR